MLKFSSLYEEGTKPPALKLIRYVLQDIFYADEVRSIPQQHDQQFSPSPNQGQGYQGGQPQHVSQNPGQYDQGFQGASFPGNPQHGQFTNQPQYMGPNFENREGMQLPQQNFGAYPDPPMQVDAPYSVSWDHTHVNTVKIIGVVGQPPRVRYKARSFTSNMISCMYNWLLLPQASFHVGFPLWKVTSNHSALEKIASIQKS